MQQVMEAKREKKAGGLGAESKGAAYKLLNGLLRRDRQLMEYFIAHCLQPLLAYV